MTKYAFDVWYSDGNDRQCIGVVGIQTGEDLESAGWMALDKAVSQYGDTDAEWDMPYADPCAVTDIKRCDHEDDSEECDSDCFTTESLSVEPCENPEEDYYHHGRASLDALCV